MKQKSIQSKLQEIKILLIEIDKEIIGIKALKCPKCNEIVWTDEVHN